MFNDSSNAARPKTDREIRQQAKENYRQSLIRADEVDRLERGEPEFLSGWWFIKNGFKTLIWTVRRAWSTVLWLVAYFIVGSYVLVPVLFLVVTWAALKIRDESPDWRRRIVRSLPVIADVVRFLEVRKFDAEVAYGNELLRRFKLVPNNGDSADIVYDTLALDSGEGVLQWGFVLQEHGATHESVKDRIAQGLSIVGAADFDIEQIGNSHWVVHFYPTVKERFLDKGQTITVPRSGQFDFVDGKQRLRVPIAFTESNEVRYLDFDGTAGCVVGGVPGSGKSAMLNVLLASVVTSPLVKVTIVDGKGGADLETFKRYVSFFSNADEDFDGVIELLESKVELLRERFQTNKKRTGQSNFWLSPIDPDHPAELLVFDEVQNWTDTTGDPKAIKDKKLRITALLTTLVKKGRSAGVSVILATQKPDSNSLPTALRDQCTRRISFRLTTREASKMVLGEAPEGAPDPVEIPNARKGGAVYANDEGDWEQIRCYFFPEPDLERYLEANATRTSEQVPENHSDVI